jgi:hypothetical protein
MSLIDSGILRYNRVQSEVFQWSILQVYKCVKVSRVETPYIYRIVKRALAAHVPLFLTLPLVD